MDLVQQLGTLGLRGRQSWLLLLLHCDHLLRRKLFQLCKGGCGRGASRRRTRHLDPAPPLLPSLLTTNLQLGLLAVVRLQLWLHPKSLSVAGEDMWVALVGVEGMQVGHLPLPGGGLGVVDLLEHLKAVMLLGGDGVVGEQMEALKQERREETDASWLERMAPTALKGDPRCGAGQQEARQLHEEVPGLEEEGLCLGVLLLEQRRCR